MLNEADIVNGMALPGNFSGDRLDAMRQGALATFQRMAQERQVLLNKIKEFEDGKKEENKGLPSEPKENSKEGGDKPETGGGDPSGSNEGSQQSSQEKEPSA